MKKIFLSSKFDEFTALRRAIADRLRSEEHIQLINLQDNKPDTRSVGELSVTKAVEADIFVLLIGETYGVPPTGHRYSYTQQEYQAAVTAFESPDILPFAIGPSYQGSPSYFGEETEFDLWRNELFKAHTVSCLPDSSSIDEIVNRVVSAIWNSVFHQQEASRSLLEAASQENPDEHASPGEDIPQEAQLSWEVEDLAEEEVLSLDEEVRRLEKKDRRTLGSVLRYTESNLGGQFADSIAHRTQAEQALKMGLYKVAETHLRHALHIRGLDFLSRDLLSRVLGVRNDLRARAEAVQECIMAARIALDRQLPFRAAGLYLRGSELAQDLGRISEAIKLARLAQEAAPSFMQPRVRLALYLYKENPKEHDAEIRNELQIAFNALPMSVSLVDRDPALKDLRLYVDGLRNDARSRIDKNVLAIAEGLSQLNAEVYESLGTSKTQLDQYLSAILNSKNLNAKGKHTRTLYKRLVSEMLQSRAEIAQGEMISGEMKVGTFQLPEYLIPARITRQFCSPGDLIEPGQQICEVSSAGQSKIIPSKWNEAFVVGKWLVNPGVTIESREQRELLNVIPERKLRDNKLGSELNGRLDKIDADHENARQITIRNAFIFAALGIGISVASAFKMNEGILLGGAVLSSFLASFFHNHSIRKLNTTRLARRKEAFKHMVQSSIELAGSLSGLASLVVRTLTTRSLPSFASILDQPRKAKLGSLLLLSNGSKGFEKKVIIQKTKSQLHGLEELPNHASLFKVVSETEDTLTFKRVA